MDKSTIVCRCEEINVDEIETVIKMGATTFDDIKRLTRCGMGPCQAKVCMNLVNRIIHDNTDKPFSDLTPANMRMPLKLTRISALASSDQTITSVTSVFDESLQEVGETNREE